MSLAPYASDPARSRGRRHPEPPAPTRNEFQRDRDRIVHSHRVPPPGLQDAGLPQPRGRPVPHPPDALAGGGAARPLDRARAAAQRGPGRGDRAGARPRPHALRPCRPGRAERLHGATHGGFEHNLQSLRVVDALEAALPGVRRPEPQLRDARGHPQALLARAMPSASSSASPAASARRFLDRTQPSLEAQLCNLADEIAYNAHDIDDGVRSGLLTHRAAGRGRRCSSAIARETLAEHPQLQGRRVLYETIRRMLSAQVYDVIDATRAALERSAPADADAVAAAPAPLVLFSDAMRAQSTELKRFLFDNLYRHPQVMQTTSRAQQVVRELFARLPRAQPAEMPAAFAPARRPPPRRRRLHRRHDRPLRHARARAPDRAAVDRMSPSPHERVPAGRAVPCWRPASALRCTSASCRRRCPALQATLGISLVEAGFLLSLVQVAGMTPGPGGRAPADAIGPAPQHAGGPGRGDAAPRGGRRGRQPGRTRCTWLLALARARRRRLPAGGDAGAGPDPRAVAAGCREDRARAVGRLHAARRGAGAAASGPR